jgi:ParB family chromosome partitioning protein
MTTVLNKSFPKSSGLGLESMGDLSALLDMPTYSEGAPLLLAIDLIDEDPNQPRKEDNPGFSKQSLGELIDNIRLRGVKTPISVRENPNAPGRYIINHGARRFRASKLAEKTTIPSYIDNDHTHYDQVVENLLRDGLTPREIADVIGMELAKGVKKIEIAKNIGKSPAFVTQHAVLLDLPDAIAGAFNSGRCRDVTIINELVMLYKKHPEDVNKWLLDETLEEITRRPLRLFREFLAEKQNETAVVANEPQKKTGKPADPTRLKKALIKVRHNGRHACLLMTRRPAAEGLAWLKYDDDGHEFEADLGQVSLIALLEG